MKLLHSPFLIIALALTLAKAHATTDLTPCLDSTTADSAVGRPRGQRIENAAQQMAMFIGERGMRVEQATSQASSNWLEFEVIGYGRKGDIQSVTSPRRDVFGNRVEYARENLVEWFLHDDTGLEHGFTIPSRGSETSEQSNAIELRVALHTNLEATAHGDTIVFRDNQRHPVFFYSGLHAWDATGRALESSWSVAEGMIVIEVLDHGAEYPIHIDPLLWSQKACLRSPNPQTSANFGGGLAIDGDTLVVGAPGDTTQGVGGTVYVYTRSPSGIWFQQAVLIPGDGGGRFGGRVAIDGDTIVVSATTHDHSFSGQGAAFVFVRNGTTWTQQAELIPSDPHTSDNFGLCDISGNTILVSAYNGDGAVQDSGCAYVFVRSGLTWTQEAKIAPADGSLDDDFGIGLAIDGETAIVSAPNDSDLGEASGSVYVFVRSGGLWSQQAKLVTSDGLAFERVMAMAIQGDTLIAATYSGNSNLGAAYVFERTGTIWTEQVKLQAGDPNAHDRFGISAALDGDTLVIGSPENDDLGGATGSIYAFKRTAGNWAQEAKLLPTDGSSGTLDRFGGSVAIDDTTIVAGASGDMGMPSDFVDAGAAYVFNLQAAPGTPFCFGDNHSGTLNCPCNGADGAPFAGCRNSAHSGGAWLSAIGTTSPNTVTFICRFLPQNAFCLLLRSTSANPVGQWFGDGVRCLQYGAFLLVPQGFQAVGGIASTSVHDVTPGQTRHYQVMYRDAVPICSPATFNVSNGYTVVW